MHKLVVLFHRPPDVMEFETLWSNEFVGRAEQMPGLRRVTVSRIKGGPTGAVPFHLIHEFYFDNAADLRTAMASPEGVAAGEALMSFAADHATLIFAQHLEEDMSQRIAPLGGES